MKKLIFIGYNLRETSLRSIPLVSGEIKNANYLMQSLKELDVAVIPVSVELYKLEGGIPQYTVSKSAAKGFFRWIVEAKKINQILSSIDLDEESVLYITVPSYLTFLTLPPKLKVVVTAHGTYWPELLADLKYEKNILKRLLHLINGYVQLKIDTKAFNKANMLHSVSDFQIAEMLNTYGLPRTKIESIRNGTSFENNRGVSKFDLIWVGRLAKKKNIQLLDLLLAKYPKLRVCIVGGNDYFAIDENSQLVVKALSQKDNVAVYENVTDEKLNELMCVSDTLIVTSTGYESIPTVIFEGLAAGCKVLAPKSWGVTEVEGNGLSYYEEGQLNDLISAYERSCIEQNPIEILEEVRWLNRARKFKAKFLL